MKRLVLILVVIFSIFSSCKNLQEEDLNLRHLNHIAESINSDLNSIKNEIINLTRTLQYKIPFDKEISGLPTDKYHYQSDQIFYCTYNSSQSAVYYPSNRNLSASLKRVIVNSEYLDSFFINSVQKKPLLAQIYFLDTNSFLRIYPYIDVSNYLKSSVDPKIFDPYQTAKEKPFIENHAYWIDRPFADPYGRGWIISCVEPIYYRDRFLGILSGDITLYSLKKKYFSSDSETIIMIDQKGKIICCTKEAAKITNIPMLRAFQYYKPVTENIYAFSKPSLLDHKNKQLRKAIKSLISGKDKEIFFIENNMYTIYKSHIRETDWLLLKIIN
ncbi:PDC sensor domain-containing protein [Bacteroidota bacterium]